MTAATSITVRVPLKIRRRPGRKTVVTPARAASTDTAIATRADPALVKALARAFRYQRLLDEGRYVSVTELARAEKLDRGYTGAIMRLTLLAPAVVDAIIDGNVVDGMTLADFAGPLPLEWEKQCRVNLGAAGGLTP